MNYLFNITEFLEMVKWQDGVDILVLAFLLYRCFVLFWGTLVFRAIIGLSLLWIINLLATMLGLIVTSLILKGLGAIVVIIVIVVFRNEIRGVISNTNLMNLFFGKPVRRRIFDYRSISDVIFSLAERKVGALLVFMRKNSLEHLVQDGVRIDAVFSRELLFSIFDNKSALHDGAVIMDGSQIKFAAAFLPLTTQKSLPLYYGSRHRAALGLSESSDAVIVVVSEENGGISLVQEGIIKKVLNKDKLSLRLEELLEGKTQKAKKSSRMRNYAQNIGVKLIFLVLALFIWFFFAGEKESVISYTRPIEFRNLPKNMELLKISAEKAEVQISGSRHILLQLKPEQVGFSLNLENSEPGKNVFPLTSKNLSIPPGLKVIKVKPDKIAVVMEATGTKSIPVAPEFVGNLPQGKELLSYKMTPDQVIIVGAPSVLKGISSIKTEPISLTEIKETSRIQAGIMVSPPSLKLSPDFPGKVTIELIIGEKVKKPLKKKQ